MLRRLNYTDRVRINHSDVNIQVEKTKRSARFSLDLDFLKSYNISKNARLFVEAYDHVTYMRFDFGPVGNPLHPPAEACELTEFGHTDSYRFRIKAVDTEDRPGMILAEADGIVPLLPSETASTRKSLLTVRSAELGERTWMVEYPQGEAQTVTLLVNQKISNRENFVRSDSFLGAAIAAILREILVHVLVIEEWRDTEDDGWKSQWLAFAKRLAGSTEVPPSNGADEAIEWVEQVVNRFCTKNKIFSAHVAGFAEVQT